MYLERRHNSVHGSGRPWHEKQAVAHSSRLLWPGHLALLPLCGPYCVAGIYFSHLLLQNPKTIYILRGFLERETSLADAPGPFLKIKKIQQPSDSFLFLPTSKLPQHPYGSPHQKQRGIGQSNQYPLSR